MIQRFLRVLRAFAALFNNVDWERREAARIEGWQSFADAELNVREPQLNW